MNIKNNEIEIIRLDDMGRGIGYINNKIIFVPNTLIGEIILVEIIKETSKYYIGNVIKYIKKSEKRLEIKCPYFDKCGGCNLLHMSYLDTLNYKKNKFENILNKFASINKFIDIESNDMPYNYRNKIELKIENGLWGYYNSGTHNFIKVKECLIAKNSINEVIKFKDYFDVLNGNIVIRSNYNDEILISINSLEDVKIDIENLKKKIKLVGIVVNDNLYYGESFFIENINNYYFKVNYNSFFQVNLNVFKKMIDYINNIKGENLLDLYCGVGVIGQLIHKGFKTIYGIEINKNSILDAIYNAKINNINNTYYLCNDSSKGIKKINSKIDTILIDPPRSGLVKNMLEDILKLNTDKIIYISCNPISFARDLKTLIKYYDIKNISLFDMFSYTYHVECCALLSLKKDQKI